MTDDKAIKVIKNERACVKRQDFCNHNCGRCDLAMNDSDILAAYDTAIETIEKSVPKKVSLKHKGYDPFYVCPHCGTTYSLKEIRHTPTYFDTVCGVCHGIMDWDDIEESEYEEY